MSNFYVVGVEVVEEQFGWVELQVMIVFLTFSIFIEEEKRQTMSREIDEQGCN